MPKSVSSLRCKKCIVVGNGYTLRGQHLGKFIDSHNVIIRINDSPLKGYENDVGKKTTFRLFFPESALTNPLENNDNDTVFILVPFKTLDLLWVKGMLQNRMDEEKKASYLLHRLQEGGEMATGYGQVLNLKPWKLTDHITQAAPLPFPSETTFASLMSTYPFPCI
uniref:Uncharacterized protein n=1 Tax=Sphaerodactylus townsendi TaxID=933632 RepID=A0ACB8F0B5_9SAUR